MCNCVIFKIERVEKSILAIRLKPHYGKASSCFDVRHFTIIYIKIIRELFNRIGTKQPLAPCFNMESHEIQCRLI